MKSSLRRELAALVEGTSTSAKLTAKVRDKANTALIGAGFDGNGRFQSVGNALAKAFDVLGEHGIEMGEVVNSWTLKPPLGRITVDLAFTNPEDSFSPTSISNSVLAFQWNTGDSGRIDVVAYLS